ncbi:hypothetical protein GCM10011369_10830 [Neiella marina]|uniref:Type 4 fimbrial biogenesis protein PilX N-terminal domain-containing protein n=1 Tax=Neiella marina TaxID=508461 RepID=A0A8J2XN63_9GAMM|nr:pilus assembly PilX N-terminal domain-containing protein [Neiella marina]GGA70966.1 hypothetical protein GCM10011369_10830 [Neiella marina]
MNVAHQSGLALFTTLILLVIITLTSVMLIRNTSFETKISGAYADRLVSEGEVSGAIDAIVDAARGGGASPFLDDDGSYPLSRTAADFPDVANDIELIVEVPGACQRGENANSQNLNLVCRRFEIDSSLSYSRSGAGQNDVATGIIHPMTR